VNEPNNLTVRPKCMKKLGMFLAVIAGMIRRTTTSVVAFLCFLSNSAVADTLTLTDFLAQVRASNPNLEAAQSRAEALEHRIGPVSTWDDPFVAAGVDEVPFGGGNGSMLRFQVSQTIPFPGKLGARGDAAERRAEAARSDAETSRRTLAVVATQTFYRTHFNHRTIELNEQNRRLIEEMIASTKARYKTGGESHHEWLLAKVELGVLGAEKLRLAREQKALHALLNELRGQPALTPIEFAKVQFRDTKEEIPDVDALLATQPEVKAAQRQADAAEADAHGARLGYLPDFVIQGMAMKPTMAEMGQPANWGVMGGINLPIFFWRKQSEQVSAAHAEQNAALAERKSLQNRLNTEIVDATEQLKTARDVVTLYKKDVIPLTEIATKNARSGYAAKRLPLTQLLETLRVGRTQNLELEAAQIDVELAKARLANLLSAPPTMRLAPARPTVFGSGAMGAGMAEGVSGTVNMGSGMSGPTRRESKPSSQGSGSSGMGNM